MAAPPPYLATMTAPPSTLRFRMFAGFDLGLCFLHALGVLVNGHYALAATTPMEIAIATTGALLNLAIFLAGLAVDWPLLHEQIQACRHARWFAIGAILARPALLADFVLHDAATLESPDNLLLPAAIFGMVLAYNILYFRVMTHYELVLGAKVQHTPSLASAGASQGL